MVGCAGTAVPELSEERGAVARKREYGRKRVCALFRNYVVRCRNLVKNAGSMNSLTRARLYARNSNDHAKRCCDPARCYSSRRRRKASAKTENAGVGCFRLA